MFNIFQWLFHFSTAQPQNVLNSPIKYQTYGSLAALSYSAHEHELYKRASVSGPVVGPNFPDPCIINVDGTWYAFATRTIGSGINIPVASSADFETWTLLRNDSGGQIDTLPVVPLWANQTVPNAWAPDVNQLDDGSFVMYFALTTAADSSHHCVGAATSATILGPYQPISTPLFCDLSVGGAIDPAGFVEPMTTSTRLDRRTTNQRYVVYKVDGSTIGHGGPCGNTVAPIQPTPLILQPVSADGLTPQGTSTTLLDNAGASDDGITEAPSLVKAPSGRYFLFFSSGCFTTPDYTVSYAVSDSSITGPYVRAPSPLFRSGDDGLTAPGGADIWQDAEHLIFHAGPWGNRQLYTALVNISGDSVSV